MRGTKFILSAIFLLILIGGGIFQYRKYRVPPEFELNRIQAGKLSGSPFRADDYTGRPIIVLYFATWCIDCRRELPQLQKLSQELIASNIKVVLLSDEDPSKLLPFEKELEEPFVLYKLNASFRESGIYTLPTAYLLNEDGSVFLQKTGAIDWTADLLKAFSGS